MNNTYEILMSTNAEKCAAKPKPEKSVSSCRLLFLDIWLWLTSPFLCKLEFHTPTSWKEFFCEYTFGRAGRGISETVYFLCRRCQKPIGEMKSKDIPREEYVVMIRKISEFIKGTK